MKRLSICFALGLTLGLACGGDSSDDSDSGMDSMNDSADSTPGETSSSMETCQTMHGCINDVCECSTPGKEGEPCDNEDACVDQCEVCV